MQLWNKSTICSLLRYGSVVVLAAAVVLVGATRRLAAARAARAWARSSWSSLELRNNGLVGDWRRLAAVPLCAVGLGLNGSTAIVVFSLSVCERERERGKF